MRWLLLCLLCGSCAQTPRDRLRDDRVIDALTPIFTAVAPPHPEPGTRVRVTVWLSDPQYRDDVRMEVLRCADATMQCLATSTEELVLSGSPKRADEMLRFEFGYDVRPGAVDKIIVRTITAERTALQSVEMSATSLSTMNEDALFATSDLFMLSTTGEEIPLTTENVSVPAGDYFPLMGSRETAIPFEFFCTAGCIALPFNRAVSESIGLISTRIRVDPEASPRFYAFVGDQGFVRFILNSHAGASSSR